MTEIFILFLGTALILWSTSFGYLLLLAALATKRRPLNVNRESLPEIAVVVPILNEERMISEKLANLRESDYPKDRMKIIVVDGGSSDRTLEHVRDEIARSEDVELIRVNNTGARSDQINYSLQHIKHDIIVFTDADARLEPSCLRELVSCLMNDPSTAIVGAFIRPDTSLLEERLYWWFLNRLWWLEGEVLSSANISGVCYACRRKQILPVAWDARADDINVALSASARRHRVRICRKARAAEIRVPQTATDLVRFRRTRGKGYLKELKRSSKLAKTPLRWQLVRNIRLWHFLVTPTIVIIFILLAVLLILSQYWLQTFFVLGGFFFPVCLALLIFSTKKNYWWRLPLASLRLAALTIISMMTLNKAKGTRINKGIRS